jgi:hypothetical protein
LKIGVDFHVPPCPISRGSALRSVFAPFLPSGMRRTPAGGTLVAAASDVIVMNCDDDAAFAFRM